MCDAENAEVVLCRKSSKHRCVFGRSILAATKTNRAPGKKIVYAAECVQDAEVGEPTEKLDVDA